MIYRGRQSESGGQASILLVDDDPMVVVTLGRIFSGSASVRFAMSGPDALRLVMQEKPDVILLDIEMPGMNGFEVCKALKEDSRSCDIPVIFISSHDDVEQEVQGLSLGAVDFICKPAREPIVLARVAAHMKAKRATDELRRSAMTDSLTGIYNRRYFDEALGEELSIGRRHRKPLSLLMIDVDHFKSYNDFYGHSLGDACLRQIAELARNVIHRPADVLARYGGEELAILLPDTPAAGAQRVALQLLDEIEAAQLPHASSAVADHVTVSIGVSTYAWEPQFPGPPPPGYTESLTMAANDLVMNADCALYAAKVAGRRQAWYLAYDDAHAKTPKPVMAGRGRARLS